jgi:hypothetical protein
MSRSIISHRLRRPAAVAMACMCAAFSSAAAPGAQGGKSKPEIELRVTPPLGVAPMRVVATAELVKGADDYPDYYCPRVQWDWADNTKSETIDDCAPYEPGKSEIRRRFAQQHVFREPGIYRIVFQLRQGTKVVGSATIKIEVHGGE